MDKVKRTCFISKKFFTSISLFSFLFSLSLFRFQRPSYFANSCRIQLDPSSIFNGISVDIRKNKAEQRDEKKNNIRNASTFHRFAPFVFLCSVILITSFNNNVWIILVHFIRCTRNVERTLHLHIHENCCFEHELEHMTMLRGFRSFFFLFSNCRHCFDVFQKRNPI